MKYTVKTCQGPKPKEGFVVYDVGLGIAPEEDRVEQEEHFRKNIYKGPCSVEPKGKVVEVMLKGGMTFRMG